MLLPGFGEMGVPVRVRLSAGLAADRDVPAAAPRRLIGDRSARLWPGAAHARAGIAGRRRARHDGAADDLGAQVAGSVIAQQMGLGFVTAVDPTQGQQNVIVGNFLTRARHHADLRDRSASPRHRGAQRQLSAVRAGRADPVRRHRRAGHQDRERRLPRRHPIVGAVSRLRPSVQYRARRALAPDAADAGVLRRHAAVDPARLHHSHAWSSA